MRNNAQKRVLSACLFALLPSLILGQTLEDTNPTDLYNPYIAHINPASIGFQDAQVITGARALHYGFLSSNPLGLRSQVFQVSMPKIRNLDFGIGVTGSYLSTPIYNDSRMDIVTSIRPVPHVGIGVSVGFLAKAFNRSQFNLVDEDDPVFREGSSLFSGNIGLGLFYEHHDNLRFGVAMQHVNGPNVSLTQDKLILPQVFHAAARYIKGRMEGTAGLLYADGRLSPLIEMTGSFQGIGLMRMGIQANNLTAGGQLHISNKVSVDYRYSYPFSDLNNISSGSHRLNFIYRLGTTPKIDYIVESFADTLLISEKRVYHRYDDYFASNGVADLELVDVAEIAAFPDQPYYSFTDGDSAAPLPDIDFKPYLEQYEELISTLADKLQSNSDAKLRVLVRPRKEPMAIAFLQYLAQEYALQPDQLEYGYARRHKNRDKESNGKTTFQSLSMNYNLFIITPRIKRKYNRFIEIKNWRLVVEASDGTVTKTFAGNAQIPRQIRWDWRTEAGSLIEAGRYGYYFEWRDKGNTLQRSATREFTVARFVREVTVEIKKAAPDDASKPERIDLMLRHDSQ